MMRIVGSVIEASIEWRKGNSMTVTFALEGMLCRYPDLFESATAAKERGYTYWVILHVHMNVAESFTAIRAWELRRYTEPKEAQYYYVLPTYLDVPENVVGNDAKKLLLRRLSTTIQRDLHERIAFIEAQNIQPLLLG